MAGFSRRAFLALAALLWPMTRLRAAQRRSARTDEQALVSVDEFMQLSRRLVGRTRLDARAGALYWDALLAVPQNGPLLAQLARRTAAGAALTPEHRALERTIVEWWYTGTYVVGGERRLATHDGALMWDAIGVPAPGTCAGEFGAWSRPPAPRRGP